MISRMPCIAFALCLAYVSLVFADAKERHFTKTQFSGLHSIVQKDFQDMLRPFKGRALSEADLKRLKKQLTDIKMLKKVSLAFKKDDTLDIHVLERKPLIKIDFQNRWYLDQDGVVFDWFGSKEQPALPVLYARWKTKTQMMESKDVFASLVSLHKHIQKQFNKVAIEYHWHQNLGWTFHIQPELPGIYIGQNHFVQRLKRLNKLMDNIIKEKENLIAIDCGFDDRVVLKKKPTPNAP